MTVMHSYARLSFFGMVAIVLLRVGVGWHFYMEGATKVRSGDFHSEGFLKGAEGPLASQFHGLIWDYNGTVRLDRDGLKKRFNDAAAQAKEHFKANGPTDQAARQAPQIASSEKIDETFAEGYDDIEKYWINAQATGRRSTMTRSGMQVASLNGQMRKVRKGLARSRRRHSQVPSTASGTQYERTPQRRELTREQFKAPPDSFRFRRPGEGMLSTRLVDQIIPIFDMVVGMLLMIGLLTPLAS